MIQSKNNIIGSSVTNNSFVRTGFGKLSLEDQIIQRRSIVEDEVYCLLCKTTEFKNWRNSKIQEVCQSIGQVLEENKVMPADEFYPAIQEEQIVNSADLDSLPLFLNRAFSEAGKMNWEVRLTVCLILFGFVVILAVWS